MITTPFVIRPADDLLIQHPRLKQLSSQLALKHVHSELVSDSDLQLIGSQLWQALDCDTAYDKACQQAGLHILPIIIFSKQAAIQQLPWETLYHPEKQFIGKNNAHTLSRQIIDKSDQPNLTPLEKGPLKILLFTSLTDDQARLDIETEQAHVQEALLPWISDGLVQLEMPDDGRFSTFKNTLAHYRPHLVFLSGHGKFYDKDLIAKQKEDYATFAFEAENSSNSEEIKGADLAKAFIGTRVQCVVLSACQSGRSASDSLNTGLMQQLASQGVPHVIGMRESILDVAGTQFSREFCDQIGQQARIDSALQAARLAITQPLKDASDNIAAELSYGQWCLPLLISQDPERALIDWQFSPQEPTFTQQTLTLQNITLASQFIGRRKEIREVFSRLENKTQQQLLITGAGGQGKTALAGRLAQKLQHQGWTILAWSARPENRWADFLQTVESQLDDASRGHYTASWRQDELSKATALLELLAKQANGKLLVFFDNLESIQNPTTRELDEQPDSPWRDKLSRLLGKNPSHFSAWIHAAQQLQPQGVSLLLTSRWKIPQWQDATQLALTQCSYNDYLALARQKPELQKLLQERGKLRKVHHTLHGNARALNFFAAAMQDIRSQGEEAQFLQTLAQAKAESQADMALAFIIKHRSTNERELLNRLQAYTCPVAIEGIIKLSLVGSRLDNPRELVSNLLDVSLLEKTTANDMQCAEYQCSSQVKQWLAEQAPPPTLPLFAAAAEYHAYLFTHERHTLNQAIKLHQALQLAEKNITANQLALDTIIGNLSQQGFYQTVLQEWLPSICESDDPKTRGKALGQTGKQLVHIGEYETALNYLKQSLNIQQEIGDKSGEGTTLNNMATTAHARGDYETALNYLKQSINIQQEIGDKSGEGTTLNNISQIYDARGDYETALKYLKQSLQIFQEIGDKAHKGGTLNNISQIYDARGDYETALKYLKQSLNIRQEIGDSSGLCATLFNIGHIHLQNEEQQEALSAWINVYQIAKPMGLAQVLEALDSLAGQLGLDGGLDAWDNLAANQ